MTLGATPSRIIRDLLRTSVNLAACGAGAGLDLAWLATRFIPGTINGIAATDTGSFLLGIVLVGAVFLVATLQPTRRILTINPIETLRSE